MSLQETAGAILRIDLDALVSNYRFIADRAAPAATAAVVKADAYGLGAAPVVAALRGAGCHCFFVAHLSEAEAIRSIAGEDSAIFVLNGLVGGTEAACARLGVIPVLNSLEQLDRWAAQGRTAGARLPGAIQVDTGMSRLGLARDEVDALRADPARLAWLDVRLMMSHLACADDAVNPFNHQQAEHFAQIADAFPDTPRALENSAGVLLPRDHLDLVRAGIALYGGRPQASGPRMLPVVSLVARILQIRTVPAGTGVGYGLTHRCDRQTRIATIGVGYADGWPRALGNRGAAYINGMRAPIIGRVSMDSITIDVTGIGGGALVPGSLVELLGPHQTIDDVAADAGTISYEILTLLGRRYARNYVAAGAKALIGSVAA